MCTVATVVWYSLMWLPVLAVGGLACGWSVLWLYRPQVRSLPRTWRWVLPGLRVVAIAALLVSLLKPAIQRPAGPEDLGTVVVLIDHSASMDVRDATWTPAELVALADGLGELPAGVSRRSFGDLSTELSHVRQLTDDAARASGELEYAKLSGRPPEAAARQAREARDALVAACRSLDARAGLLPEPLAAVNRWGDVGGLIDAKGRAAWAELRSRADAATRAVEAHQAESDAKLYEGDARVREACDALKGQTRLSLAGRIADRAVLSRLPVGVPTQVFAIRDRLTPLPLNPGTADSGAAIGADARADTSDVAGALRAVGRQMRGRPVQAIVLLSDGRQVGPETTGGSSNGVGSVPTVFAIRPTPGAVRDVAITELTVPAGQFAGETATVRVGLRSTGLAGVQVNVEVTAAGVTQSRAVTTGPDGTTSVDFPVRFWEAGTQKVLARVTPVEGESTERNNAADRWVKVLSRRLSVGAFSGSASWEHQFVRAALLGTPWIDLSHGILAGGTAMPLRPWEIESKQVLILHDVAGASLSDTQWEAVRELVVDRGGSLVLVAGDVNWPLDATTETFIGELLPYRPTSVPVWRTWPGDRPYFRPLPPPGTEGTEVARIGEPGVSPAQAWSALPPMYRYLHLGELRPGVRPLLLEHESAAPVMTEARVGAGRVLLLAFNETWRWRSASPDAQDRFWRQLVRYAGEEPYAAESAGYALDVDRVQAEPGESIRVRAKVPPRSEPTGTAGPVPARPDAPRLPSVLVMSEGRVVRSEELAPAGPADSGRHETVLRNLQPGTYVLRLDTGADDDRLAAIRVPLHVASASAGAELADVSPDTGLLQRLAEPTGGRAFAATNIDRLDDEILRRRDQRPRFVELALWDSPYLFIFVVACMGTEWALRKRLGLA